MAKLPDGVVDDPHSACKDESEQLDGQKGTLFSGRAFAAAKLLHESSGDQDTRVRLRAPGKASPPWCVGPCPQISRHRPQTLRSA